MPCFNTVPISIIPPTAQGKGPLVWQNGSQINRLNSPLNPSLVLFDGSVTRFGDGSAQSPIALPNIQQSSTLAAYYLAVDGNGVVFKTPLLGYAANILGVAGGGSGGGTGSFRGGGGGAGGVIQIASALVPGSTYSVIVGNGGLATTALGTNGGNSSFGTFNAIGGGGGASGSTTTNGLNGGSGGGGNAITSGTAGVGGIATANQGNNGGAGSVGSFSGGGGGGGGGGIGTAGLNISAGGGGAGGIGIASTIYDGTIKYYGGGGGGSNRYTGSPTNVPLGGNGGGGNGFANASTIATSGTANTGGGGGGTDNNSSSYVAGNGGSGIVIISYNSPTQLATGGTITSYTSGSSTFWVHTFTNSGNFIS